MKILKILGLLVLLFLISIVGLFAYYGGFHSVKLEVVDAGGEVIIYESHTGNYANTAEVMERIYTTLLNEEKIEATKGIGVYYDDPQKVKIEKLRYEAGEILEGVSEEKLSQLKEKYQIRTLPKGKYLTAEFPFKGFPSIFIGIMKAYPAMRTYFEENKINSTQPSQEIYDIPGQKTIYRIQLD